MREKTLNIKKESSKNVNRKTNEEVLKFLGIIQTDEKRVNQIASKIESKIDQLVNRLNDLISVIYNLQELDFLEKKIISISNKLRDVIQDRKKQILGMDDIKEPINFHWSRGYVEVRWRSATDGKEKTRSIPKELRMCFVPPEKSEKFTDRLKNESKEGHPTVDDKKLR